MGESKGQENLHLITYDIAAGKYKDHGPIFYEDGQRPAYVNSIGVGKDGTGLHARAGHRSRQDPDRPDRRARAVQLIGRRRTAAQTTSGPGVFAFMRQHL